MRPVASVRWLHHPQPVPPEEAILNDDLADALRRLRARPLDASALEPLFAPDARDEYEPDVDRVQRAYEHPVADWAPIICNGELPDPPMRFIDGSMHAQVVACMEDGRGRQRPAVLTTVGAVALDLTRSDDGTRLKLVRHAHLVATRLVVLANGFGPRDLSLLEEALRGEGIELVAPAASAMSPDFEEARGHTLEFVRREMLGLESELLRCEPGVPTVVDGLLDQRIESFPSHNVPAIGVVKRQLRSYLHPAGLNLVYALAPGQRTPAILLDTTRGEFVTFYLRLAAADGGLPSAGVVRVMVSKPFYEDTIGFDSRYLNALGWWLCRLRCRQSSYPRMLVSLEPIVIAEDHIRALLPDVAERVAAFRRVTGLTMTTRRVA